ncbi:methyltransferase domain-containing protein [Kribbella sp. NPDC051952]|uniref:class I SAM-dependent methyltransferase n=1 Tax=Kribbella sp. NPDC051952 TaxID=3154851 RepID=UPI00341F04B8
MSEITRKNGRYWEAMAGHRRGETVEHLRSGGEVISPEELAVIGPVAGRRFLQVAASVGDAALSVALQGAQAVAVDIAPSHVATGRAKAAELGVEVDFRVGDMTALPEDLTGFDTIYISWGGLCWVPDLPVWVADMATRLSPGGRLVIAEHHPVWEVLSVAGPDLLALSASYFEQTWIGERDLAKEPQVVKELGLEWQPHRAFVWNLGDVISAFLRAGLVVVALQEFGDREMYPGFAHGQHLPSTYIAAGERPKCD